jgi:hypothetical protein
MKGASHLIMRWGRATRAQKKVMTGSSCKSDELNGCTNGRAYQRRTYARRAENKMLTSSPICPGMPGFSAADKYNFQALQVACC